MKDVPARASQKEQAQFRYSNYAGFGMTVFPSPRFTPTIPSQDPNTQNMPETSKKTVYDNTRQKATSQDEFLKSSLARIQQVQMHLDTTPRGIRMKGKVCIITGAGSLKGIGCVKDAHCDCYMENSPQWFFYYSRATAFLFAHEGKNVLH